MFYCANVIGFSFTIFYTILHASQRQNSQIDIDFINIQNRVVDNT